MKTDEFEALMALIKEAIVLSYQGEKANIENYNSKLANFEDKKIKFQETISSHFDSTTEINGRLRELELKADHLYDSIREFMEFNNGYGYHTPEEICRYLVRELNCMQNRIQNLEIIQVPELERQISFLNQKLLENGDKSL